MAELRILVANEPRSYREVLAGSLGVIHPHAALRCTGPTDVDAELEHFDPHLIICSELTQAVEDCDRPWVLLYPEGKPLAVVCLDGEPMTAPNIEFNEILSIVDRVDLRVYAGKA